MTESIETLSRFPLPRRRAAWLGALLVFLWAIGTLRAFLVWSHDPLYAYANSYDETRYTSCFQLYPDRPDSIPPQRHSPEAPFEYYRFIATGDPMCYWSTELAFGGITAGIWKTAEALSAPRVHNVRVIGALRWCALLALSIALSMAWLRRGDSRAAIANAALVPLVFADPGNTLYLNTFYAEWTALLAAYASIALILLWRDAERTRGRFVLLALAVFVLAASKMQHLALPLALAVVVLVLDRIRLRRTTWRALALAIGALAGLCFQFVQQTRGTAMMDAIRQYNAADVVFTALLPFAGDRHALLGELGIDPACAAYSGRRAWQLPDMPERACPGLVDFTHGKEIATLARHPGIVAALVWHGVLGLDPWIAGNVGHVEGASFAPIPGSVPTVHRILDADPAIQLVLIALPPFALILLSIPRRARRGVAFELTALIVVTMGATLAVALLGDGLADTAKQGHLVVDAALAWLAVGIMMVRPGARSRTDAAPPRGAR